MQRHGAHLEDATSARFALWAPDARSVSVELQHQEAVALAPEADGWFTGTAPAKPGDLYRYCINGELRVADPASRFQPEGVHGPSQVVNLGGYAWQHCWQGRPWYEAVIQELHVGVLGGYEGVASHLQRIASTGITAIELMPISQFPGTRNWGYDGVLPYAAQHNYGTPEQLCSLVDQAHGHGLMVMLDVVYNHFGPDGNFLHEYASSFFREDRHTPWGAAIDFRRPEVREFFIQNALMWICDYRIDGLRLDAVHAIDQPDFLEELAQRVREAVEPGRHVWLVLENEHNQAFLLEQGFDAQWNDDGHNALHVLLTNETEGYYEDYKDDPIGKLARCLGEGFVFQGQPNRHGEPRGEPSGHLPPSAFVLFLQNHDQIGNRAMGERLTRLTSPAALRAATGLLLLSPMIPLLFMGDDDGSRAPFLFFTDFHDELADAVREGRRGEFEHFAAFADPEKRARIPDPNAEQTFHASRPDPQDVIAGWHGLYQQLLTTRRQQLVPRLPGTRPLGAEVLADKALTARWQLGDGSTLRIDLNLGDQPLHLEAAPAGSCLFDSGDKAHAGSTLSPYSCVVTLLPPRPEDAMSDSLLHRLAQRAGLARDWVDANNKPQQVTDEVLRKLLEALGHRASDEAQLQDSLSRLERSDDAQHVPPLLTADQGKPLDLSRYFPAQAGVRGQLEDSSSIDLQLDAQAHLPGDLPVGYHQLEVAQHRFTLAVAPSACPSLHDLVQAAPARCWGLSAQLYSLRRPGDGGYGDCMALEQLVRSAAERGADAVAISPIHALSAFDQQHYSPYSPSSRLLLNTLYASPAAILGERTVRLAIEACHLEQTLTSLEQEPLVDWPRAADARYKLLDALYQHFSQGDHPQRADFESYRQAAGEALEHHCRFEVLQAEAVDKGHGADWRNWPEAWRDPFGTEVRALAESYPARVEFHAFCQWLTERSLQRAQEAAKGSGMVVGLIADLAVGADGAGSQAWSRQDELLANLTVGAPPDILNRSGQDWGICGFSPEGLKRNGYRAFIEMLRANLAHAGGLRIDHVMGLQRLWLIPRGCKPNEGAYLYYPLEDMLRLLALEASRHGAIILGEDLGTVPDGLREALAQKNILGMRVLPFEQTSPGQFTPQLQWPDDALATTGTHDLATVAGWLKNRDVEWSRRLGLIDESTEQQWRDDRRKEHDGLRRTLETHYGPLKDDTAVIDAAIGYVGHTKAPLVLVPLEDLLGLEEQPNMPGTTEGHPNWRRRFTEAASHMLDDKDAARRLEVLAQAREQAWERDR